MFLAVAAADCCLLGAWEAGTAVECGLLRTARAGGLVLPCSRAGTGEWRLRAAAAPCVSGCLPCCWRREEWRTQPLRVCAQPRNAVPAARAVVLAARAWELGAWELGGAAEPDWSLEVWRRSGGRRRRRSAGQWRTPWEVGARVVALWGELRRGRVLAWAVSL
jgi:hypothetical protein